MSPRNRGIEFTLMVAVQRDHAVPLHAPDHTV